MLPKLHPACNAFPPLPASELRELAADIKANGLLEPIVLLDSLLLDGRCRWQACELADVEPRTTEFTGDDPVAFVASKNRHRRHLTKSQKAMIAARLSKLPPHRPKVTTLDKGSSLEELSQQLDTPRAYTQYGRTVLATEQPHIIEMVDSGGVNVRIAGEAVVGIDQAVLATWTKADVEREGQKKIRAYPSNQRRSEAKTGNPATKGKPAASKSPPPIIPSGGFTKLDIGPERIPGQPVNLWPAHIQRLMDADIRVRAGAAGLVRSVAVLDPPQLAKDVENLLAYQPVAGKKNGEERNFAKETHKALHDIEQNIDKAIECLQALRDVLRARNEKAA